ncbi:MAG: serine/threonine protein kinase [Chrysiogenetes bacterium]|nr:serine/threonine protein kinase [Chrysiogenetes bacterium]
MQSLSVSSRYRVIRRLHVGGMAEVFLAVSEGTIARRVVIKRMLPELARLEEMRLRFAEEARLLSRLAGPGLPAVYDAGEDEEGPFLIEQFIPGLSLRELLDAAGPLGSPEVAAILVQALTILSRLHEARDESGRPLDFVHRDLAPENLLLDPEGKLWLLDLGIAKSRESQVRTQAGIRQGRAAYMAPEQLLGRKALAASDLYALALVGAELSGARLAGVPVHGDTTPAAEIERLARMEAAERAHWPDECDAELRAVIERLLTCDPASRVTHAGALAALDEIAEASGLSRRVMEALDAAGAEGRASPRTAVLPGGIAGSEPVKKSAVGRKKVAFGLVALTALAGGIWGLNRGEIAPESPPRSTSESVKTAVIPEGKVPVRVELPEPGVFALYLDGRALGQASGSRSIQVDPGTHTLLLTEESTNRYYREDFLTRLGETRLVRFPLGWEGDQESTQQGEKEDE